MSITIIRSKDIEYRFEDESPWLIEVEGDHDNEPVIVDISSRNWTDIDDLIMVIHDEIKLNDLFNFSGNAFIVNSEWVEKKDPEVYNILLSMIKEFADNKYNSIYQGDIADFLNGTWVVEYTFRNMSRNREFLVSAGKDYKHVAKQPAWIHYHEGFCGLDFRMLPIEAYLKKIR